MQIVEIDLSTIRKNPNAGSTSVLVQGHQTISFKIEGKLPEFMQDNKLVYVERWQEGKYYEGTLMNDELIERILKTPGIIAHINMDKGIERVPTLPQPEYLFSYKNTMVQCGECKTIMPVQSVIFEFDEDYGEYELCPVCRFIDKFDICYESIKSALKRKQIQ